MEQLIGILVVVAFWVFGAMQKRKQDQQAEAEREQRKANRPPMTPEMKRMLYGDDVPMATPKGAVEPPPRPSVTSWDDDGGPDTESRDVENQPPKAMEVLIRELKRQAEEMDPEAMLRRQAEEARRKKLEQQRRQQMEQQRQQQVQQQRQQQLEQQRRQQMAQQAQAQAAQAAQRAAAAPTSAGTRRAAMFQSMNAVRQGVIMREILGPPKSLQPWE